MFFEGSKTVGEFRMHVQVHAGADPAVGLEGFQPLLAIADGFMELLL